MIESKYKIRAIELANTQGELANSPVEVSNNGDILLCAAACLAYAGVEIEDGKPCAEQFLYNLAANNEKEAVVEVFERFGWGSTFCNLLMVNNDRAQRNQRIRVFMEGVC